MSEHDPEGRDPAAPADPSRRRALTTIACAAGALTGVAVAAPVLVVVHDPVGRTTVTSPDHFIPVGPAERFAVGEPVRVELRAHRRNAWSNAGTVAIGRAWVRRLEAPGAFEVLSAICPHLGCEIGLSSERDFYTCPCHESLFALDGGEVEAGPSPRGLDPLEHRVSDDGTLEIRFLRFELNTVERTPQRA